MKVGLDHIPLMQLFEWEPLQFMEEAADFGFEGILLPRIGLLSDEAYRKQVIEKKNQLNMYIELGGAGIDTALSGRSTQELLSGWKPAFDLAQEMDVKMLLTSLGTWPWQGRIIKEEGKSVADQINGGIATLRELSKMAQDYDIFVGIHTSFFTAEEYVQIMESVDSSHIGLCLDTANAFLVLQDPVDFAKQVAPWVKGTHLKDSCIYLQPEGIDWLGGCPLGRGSVDLPTIVELLYEANPEINLSVEDHWGRTKMPINEEVLESIPNWSGTQVVKLLRHLQKGEELLRAGMHPTIAESNQIDWKNVFPERARYCATYAKQIRDKVIQKENG